jgi:cysteine desulfurase
MARTIYFDHAATTPISEDALTALTTQAKKIGNPSSLHGFGQAIRGDVEIAREMIANAISAQASEVIFTGSGTEANNTAIKGLFWSRAPKKIIVTTKLEHHAVHDPIHWLAESEGAQICYIESGSDGSLNLSSLQNIVSQHGDEISFIAILYTNNEIGTSLNPAEVEAIKEISGEIPVHYDAVQSIGKVGFNFKESGAISAALSAHKVGGPLGVGALILKRALEITPILHGGGQERDIRSGTLNAPGIVAFATALTQSIANLEANRAQLLKLRSYFLEKLSVHFPDATINGRGDAPGIISVTFPQTKNETSLLLFDNEQIACSTGSACSQGLAQPSHVLLALGLDEASARATLRFSLNQLNDLGDIDEFFERAPAVIDRAQAAFLVTERAGK